MAKQTKVSTGIRSLLSTPTQAKTPTPPATTETKPTGGRGRKSADPVVMIGAGIKTSEKAALYDIAKTEGVAVNALIAFAIRDTIKRYQTGKLKLPKTTITRLDAP